MNKYYAKIIESLGEDLNRDGLKGTPKRAEQAMKFLTQGYHESLQKIVNGALFETDNDEMIVVKDIELYSLCEHHLLPLIGKCHVAYIPKDKIIGLSKIARVVDMFGRRLQVQEKLTKQIAETISEITGAIGVGVVIQAKHLCMMMRGVEKQNSVMATSVMLGSFREDTRTRTEFLSFIKS
jgi:GTP cyclohydrolase IA